MQREKLNCALLKMLNIEIMDFEYSETDLQGGTIGAVKLVSGTAEAAVNNKIPFKLVYKRHEKFERYGDPGSWRREHDLYSTDLQAAFDGSFRMPKCYHTEITDKESHIFMEYVEGISGSDLTIGMFEQAAEAIGQFQGMVYTQNPAQLKNELNLGTAGFLRKDYMQWKPETSEYRYVRSDSGDIPVHLKEMIIDMDNRAEELFGYIEELPKVLCHRDYWHENIIITDNGVVAIDWDTAGWGYLGEDIASLIIDDTNSDDQVELYKRLIPAYYKGLAKHMRFSDLKHNYIHEIMLIKEGYRNISRYINWEKNRLDWELAERGDFVRRLQNIFDMKKINV